MKKALLTGITGMDGSHLADLLLSKGYEVHGIIRRASTINTSRIDHLYQDPHVNDVRLFLHFGDLSDASSLTKLIYKIQPDEIYNLGAQSHVRVSFDVPEYTADVTALGTIRILEAMRESGVKSRFYQASSSEMFGKVQEIPQTEMTPFWPRSPYGVAKLFAYWATVNYRESYGMHASNGILFNHECLTADTPVIYRRHGKVDIKPICELVTHREDPSKGKMYQTIPVGLEVWDGFSWTEVTLATANWKSGLGKPNIIEVNCRGSFYNATPEHVSFLKGDVEIKTGDIVAGDTLALKALPSVDESTSMSIDEAELLGMLVADGYLGADGRGNFSKNDDTIRARAGELWSKVSGGYFTEDVGPREYNNYTSVKRINLNGNRGIITYWQSEMYTETKFKRIPSRVLNASDDVRRAFLMAYNACDGLKGGYFVNQELKSFTTNSATLAQGLYLLCFQQGYRVTLHPEKRDPFLYFHLNINVKGAVKGQHLVKPLDEVKDSCPQEYEGWVFDLATKSGTFSAGVGLGWIHNSPRRGETFVTRKITKAVAAIVAGKQADLFLGNLDAKRDWGYAPEFVEGMWRMLQQDEPGDYVLATGETHTVREFVKEAFAHVGLDWQDYVKYDARYERPAEVDLLIGDPSKAKRVLGWEPKTTFKELVRIMVDSDVAAL